MKRTLLFLFLITASAFAQIQPVQPPVGNINGDLFASGYGGWSVPMGNNGSTSWTSGTFCSANYGGTNFAAFTVGTPIKINDLINPANSDIVTVTNVISNPAQCAISTTAPAHQHQSFNLGSATAGIQEAINANIGTQVPLTIHLTADWYRLGGTLSMVTATAQGNINIGIVDDTQTPSNWYQWGGSHYALISIGGGSSAIFTPTTPGTVPGGRAPVYLAQIAAGTDACTVINNQAATLPSTNGVVDATWLPPGNYTCVNPIRLNTATQAVSLWLQDGVIFTFNTVLGTTKSPSNCAVSVGPGGVNSGGTAIGQPNGGSSIIVFGHNYLGGNNFVAGPNFTGWGLICNGSFKGSQESFRLDGVSASGNSTAQVAGALIYIAGVFGPTRISNGGTSNCFAQCFEGDAGDGSISSGAGNWYFDNDVLADGYTGSQQYPGSVVKFDALTSSGGIGNVYFSGGIIQDNGPCNPLIVINGRGSSQLGVITFQNTYPETRASSPCMYNSDVSPIQIIDASQIWIDNMRVGGSRGTAPNLVEISSTAGGTGSSTTYGIKIDGLSTGGSDGYSCLIRNFMEGAGGCETGFATGAGDLYVPPYFYGGNSPGLRLTNYAPPSSACTSGTLGSIWTNSTDTSTSGPVSYCQVQAGVIGWYKPQGSGGGSGNAITALTGDVSATGPGSVSAQVTGLMGTPIGSLSGLLQLASGVPSAATSVNVTGSGQFGTYSRSGIFSPACGSSVVFDASKGDYQYLNLNCNVTSSSLIGTSSFQTSFGQHLHFTICNAGGFAFNWPTSFVGVTPVTTGTGCTVESFIVENSIVQADSTNSANCITSASLASCGQAVQGEVAFPSGTNPSLTINTTGYIAGSQLIFTPDQSIGGDLGVTCNASGAQGHFEVTGFSAGVSVTMTWYGTVATNPLCGKFSVRNL